MPFVWERPLPPKEIQVLEDHPLQGQILAARVEHVGAREALIAEDPGVYFTTAHFDGHAAILVRLDEIDAYDLQELVTEMWLARASRRPANYFSSAVKHHANETPATTHGAVEIWAPSESGQSVPWGPAAR
jgi:hypothetical protein